jgi:transcription initiation factor TFIID subunit 5
MAAISQVQVSPDIMLVKTRLSYFACIGEDLAINLWDLGSGKRIKKMMGHTASIYSLAFSAESSLLVSGGADCTVRCWDVKNAGGAAKRRPNGVLSDSSFPTEENASET